MDVSKDSNLHGFSDTTVLDVPTPRLETGREPAREPIAIIGIGCRFPGARGHEAFWKLLRDGVDALTEIPPDRFDINAYHNPRPGTPGKIVTRQGGFLEEIDQFAPYFFGISPREATTMDPQQRLLLEVAWEALEDAGVVPGDLAGSPTGVFIGMCASDYGDLQLHLGDLGNMDVYSVPGSARSILAGRLSYILDLQGPAVAMDTACSSSLIAVHLACQSLWLEECTLAFAGGVNVILMPEPFVCFSLAGMLAPDGRCKFGDARADGFVRGEGAGVVVLKRLSLALADGDPVHAVIRGSAANNDGRSSGLMMPSRPAQEAVLRDAFRNAGVSARQVQYVEAHGTGTIVGDPIEMRALGAVLAEGRPEDRPCVVGSAKTNIGHLEGGAGIAGLIKVALALKHRAIPPSLHLEEPNPNIPWEELPLVIPQELKPWPEHSGPALAGVNSFGIAGTNVHIVLEEAPQASPAPPTVPAPSGQAHLLPLSAHSPEAMEAMVRAYHEFVTSEDEDLPSLQDICYTASARRTHHDHRLGLVVHSRAELAEHLEAFLKDEVRPGMSSGVRALGRQSKLAMVFAGQGPKWWPLDHRLLEQESVFRETLDRCDEVLRQYAEDWSLLEQLTADEAHCRLHETNILQPALLAVQVALVALWRSWGIEPDAIVGHSVGEVAAAHVAGALSLEDALWIISHRGPIMKQVVGKGRMALVALSVEQAQEALKGYEGRLSVAVSNSPASTVLSGETAALEEVLACLEQNNVFCRLIPAVDLAAHSPQMEPLSREIVQALEGLQPRPTSVPFYSTVTGQVMDGLALDAHYWGRNLREPVLFSVALEQLLADGHDLFLEVHPHIILARSIQEGLGYAGREGAVFPSLKYGEEGRLMMLGTLGGLYTQGYPVNWSKLYPTRGRVVGLPSYPWQRERYWVDIPEGGDGRSRRQSYAHRSRYPLLGQHFKSAVHPGTHFWEMDLGTDSLPWLADHRVQGLVVLPAAAYADVVLSAAEETFGPGSHSLEKVGFKRALVLPEEGTRTTQLVLSPEMPGQVAFQFFSREADAAGQQDPWTLHATGTIRLGQPDQGMSPDEHASPEEIQARCPDVIPGAEHYETMAEQGLQYGPEFQGVAQIWRRDGEAIGHLGLSETVASESGSYKVHPALLDACFQVLEASVPRAAVDSTAEGDIYLPVGLSSLRVYHGPDTGVWSHTRLRLDDASVDMLEGDVFLLDEEGRVVLEVLGLRIQRLGYNAQRVVSEDLDDWLYEVQWQPKARPEGPPAAEIPPPSSPGSWLIFADSDGLGKAMAARMIEQGERCVLVSAGKAYKRVDREYYQIDARQPEEMHRLLEAAFGSDQPALRGVIHLWGLDISRPEETTIASLEMAQSLGPLSILHLVQALAKIDGARSPRLWLVTRGSQAVGTEGESVSVGQAPLWGLGKVISFEHPELCCTGIDLDPSGAPEEVDFLLQELWLEDQEEQLALRGDTRYVARVVRYAPGAAEEKKSVVPGDHPYHLEISPPGVLDNLELRATTRQEPGPGEVEIQVHAAGLNFLDVLSALGMRPDQPEGPMTLGMECAGEVVSVGEGVDGVQVGDKVIAAAPSSFSRYVITAAPFVVPKPANLSFEEAASIPVAFLTAHYALNYLGRLSQGERVLIHAAAGGVGLAAVRLAQRVGAEIFATAGSPEKREFLRSLGVEHVMNSRSLDFAEEVMERTGGEGIDVVLNSLAGEFIPKSLSTLRANGRFLEIGKRDIYQNSQLEMGYLRDNLSFFAIDLIPLFVERPDLTGALSRELVQLFEEGSLELHPCKVFSITEAESAFRYMAQAKHIGKIVLSMQEEEVLVAPAVEEPVLFRSDGTYLITGGLGGLGLSVAQWMVQQGARHLALMSRSGTSTAAQEAMDAMEEAGAQVTIAKGDVTQEEQVAKVLAGIGQSMPPLRGIIHAAGVLDDGILLHLTEERFKKVMAPKVDGAWNLHNLTLNDPLDHFVLFSSVASVLGSPGQGNYVAANAFLDALAHYRHTLGLPALTINWGAWAEVGLATRADRVRHVTQQGIIPFTPAQGVQLMERMLHYGPVQVTGIAVDWAKLPIVSSKPLLSQLAQEAAQRAGPSRSGQKKDGLTREKLLAVESEERQQLVETLLKEQIAKVLRSSPDRIDVHLPMDKLGIDSLMGFELINRLESDLEMSVPMTVLLQGPSLAQLTTELLDQLALPSAAPTAPAITEHKPEDELLAEVDRLSDEEVDAMLREIVEEADTETT